MLKKSKLNKLILWVGEKHSGKTAGAANLARTARAEGFNVAGLLAPSLYCDGRLIGFDALDLKNDKRAPLARLQTGPGKSEQFTFITDGLKLGDTALISALANVQLAEGIRLGDTRALQMISSLSLAEGLKLGDNIIIDILLLALTLTLRAYSSALTLQSHTSDLTPREHTYELTLQPHTSGLTPKKQTTDLTAQ